MAEDENSLDAFISTGENASTPPTAKPVENSGTEIDLEAEFAKLLNDFITPSAKPEQPQNTINNAPSPDLGGLDSFITSTPPQASSPSQINTPQESASLDSFVTSTNQASGTNTQGLDSFITNAVVKEAKPIEESPLKAEEKELARAISNFQECVFALADEKNYKVPETDYKEELLIPNYKPSVGKKIAQYMLSCWDLINKYDPESMKRLSKDASDEDYLNFAEGLTNINMQGAIVSYVQILINIEMCEVIYEQKKEILQKNRIKRELYEEYMELQERKELFIQKIKEKNFPIDVTRLMNNYFRVAQKDADGAFDALTKNPAMFSPIEVDKIKPKFFGLIKVTPEDGIKMNQKIGKFIKNLKV